jgi:outer membrane protein assembly factor BamD
VKRVLARSVQAALTATVTAMLLVLQAGCASTKGPDPEAAAEAPTAEALFQKGSEILEGHRFPFYKYVNYQAAIDAFQEVIDNYPYSDYAVMAELAIADAYYDDGRYEEALSYYQDFPELHPNHERVPYTLLRAAMCHYKRARSPNRDQRPTREALKYLDKLMSTYPYTPESEQAEVIWRELRTRLGRSVLLVADFYMDRSEYQSAADRYRDVLNEYPGLGLDAEALYKLGVCYSKMRLNDEAQRIFQVILDNYQGTDVANAAADLIPSAQ